MRDLPDTVHAYTRTTTFSSAKISHGGINAEPEACCSSDLNVRVWLDSDLTATSDFRPECPQVRTWEAPPANI